jgi:Flp pilus assembly protein TadG
MRPAALGRETGQTIVEFAFASLLFFTTVFGIISFGIAIWRYNMVADLAQEGARRASVCGKKKVLSSTECDISAYVSGRSVGLSVTTTTTPSDLTTLGEGQSVTVQVQHLYSPLTRFVPGATMTLRSRAIMIAGR